MTLAEDRDMRVLRDPAAYTAVATAVTLMLVLAAAVAVIAEALLGAL